MVVRKAGGPNISKKKNIEEAKRMAEKKKLMMKEEESEDEDMSEEESDDDDDMSDIEVGSDESDESEEEEEESDEDDDDSLDEEEDTKKPNKSRDLGQSFADKSMNSKTPVKPSNKTPAKTPNKLTVQQNSQKKQIENKTSKTPKQQNVFQSKLEFSPSPKKNDDNLKTPASLKQSKAAGSAKRKAIEMEEDDDDDDDDDEEEEDDDDDDDDEEEEDDDDEEEEEDDDDDDEKEAPKLVKAVEPPAKKAKNDVPSIDLKASEEQRRKDRDIRSLFIRGFPDDTTEEEIKALSSDIISVRLPANKKRKRPGMQGGYAFVEFKSEKIAEDNFSVFEKKKIRGKELFVDFVGSKSKNKAFVDRTKERDQRNINKQKLFVSNIPNEATMEDLGKAFPAAVNVYLNSGANRTAQISFDSEEAAAEAFKKNSSLKIKGTPVVVLYALINKHRNKGKGGRGQGSPRRPFHRGQGFRKSFNEQRKPSKHSFDDEDDE